MVRVIVELVVFTFTNNGLVVLGVPDRDGMVLPSREWDGSDHPQRFADALVWKMVGRVGAGTATFMGNYAWKPPEQTLSIGYCMCARATDLSEDAILLPPNHTSPLSKRQRGMVYDAQQWLRARPAPSLPVAEMLDEKFTLAAFQEATEIINGRALDKRHFRRQAEELEWLEFTGEKIGGAHRPAMLYAVSRLSPEERRYREIRRLREAKELREGWSHKP